jgi:hypothetical protein
VHNGAAFHFSSRTSGLTKYVEAGTVSPLNVDDTRYTVASTEDLSMRTDVLGTAATRYEAMAALQSHLAAHPEDRGSMTILPLHEMPI